MQQEDSWSSLIQPIQTVARYLKQVRSISIPGEVHKMNIEKKGQLFLIEASRDELGILNDCINDAIDLINPKGFDTRVAATLEEVEALLDVIQAALRPRPA
jgi:hypothetical protein